MATDRTWLAAFAAEVERSTESSLFQPYVAPGKVAGEKVGIVIEVTRKLGGEWLVVFAVLRPVAGKEARELTAVVAFSDSSIRCDRLNRDGLPAFEAEIEHDRRTNRLSITIQAFAAVAAAGEAPPSASPATFVIEGLPITAQPDSKDDQQPAVDVLLHFQQTLASPSPVDPGGTVQLMRSGCRVQGRFKEPAVRPDVCVSFPALRYPDLSPLDAVPRNQRAFHVWRGSWSVRQSRARQPEIGPPAPVQRLPERARSSQPNVPASFRFENVEWLGFRLNLRDTGAATKAIDDLLRAMLAALNDTGGGAAAGCDAFVPASSTINIDLLRYGRMKLGRPWGKLSGEEYFSQHELVLRLAVRRADDPMGHGVAVHVPVIFVDNPWSRHLGREMLGFDKRRFAVYDAEGRLLRDDGRRTAGSATAAVALTQVRQVVLRDRLAPTLRHGGAAALLALDYSIEPERAAFIDVADDRLLAPSALASFGWRAGEIDTGADDAFGTDVRAQRLSGFRSVQAAPVDGRPLSRAIVESRTVFQRLRLAFPDGLAILSLGAPGGAPPAWLALQGFLRKHGGAEVTLPAGDWYRMRCDMRLDVIDPLGW